MLLKYAVLLAAVFRMSPFGMTVNMMMTVMFHLAA